MVSVQNSYYSIDSLLNEFLTDSIIIDASVLRGLRLEEYSRRLLILKNEFDQLLTSTRKISRNIKSQWELIEYIQKTWQITSEHFENYVDNEIILVKTREILNEVDLSANEINSYLEFLVNVEANIHNNLELIINIQAQVKRAILYNHGFVWFVVVH